MLENNRNVELVTSATSKIYEKINTALSKNDSDKRWFWELLQNAKDTVVQSKGKVDVRVVLSRTAGGEPFMRFEHNGGFFKPSNHRFKFDDPKCLLLADSGKIEEDETQREDITGQFGTGFLSTHVISLKILVEGVFIDKESNFNSFSFTLDRRYKTKFDLAEKVEQSLSQYDSSFRHIQQPDSAEFSTKFTYFLNENRESPENGLEVVSMGIKGIETYIPFVLSFCKEINSVTIIDELIEKQSVLFTRHSELNKQDKEVQIIKINKKKNNFENYIQSSRDIEIALCSDLVEYTDLAIELERTDTTYRIKPIDSSYPVLFCTFPLVGSEKWRYPVMLNCTKFVPKTERDGILLVTGKDSGNQEIVKKSAEIYKKIVEFAINEKWQDLFWLAQTTYEICPTEWTSEDWYKNLFKDMRTYLLNQNLVIKENGEHILLKNTLFPYHSGKEKLDIFWSICNSFIPDSIPKKEETNIWNKIINANYLTWETDFKYNIERLLKEIQNFGSLNQLTKDKFNEVETDTIYWLNKVIEFVQIEAEKPELLTTYKIIPNQLGEFTALSENLHYDNEISEELKNILEPFANYSFKKILIDNRITGFEKHSPKTTKDISDKINILVNSFITNNYLNSTFDPNNTCRGVFYKLISFLPDDNFSERRHLYDIFQEIMSENIETKITIVKNIAEFDFSTCNNWIINELILRIQNVENGNILGLQNSNGFFKSKNSTEILDWLDNFIAFVADFEDKKYKVLLEKYKIIPNQSSDFCSFSALYKDNKIPIDLIEIAQASHINKKWTDKLAHNSLIHTLSFFDDKMTLDVEDIASEINSIIRDYEGNKQDKYFAELVFMLNKSESVNSFMYKKLFSDFHSKRDSLIVGTLGDGKVLSDVAILIQNPEKLAIFATLADNKNISKAQLEEFSKILSSDDVRISAILDFAKNGNSNPQYGLIQFEGFNIDFDDEKSDFKQIAVILYRMLKEGFIDPLKDAGLNYSDFRILIDKYKRKEILVRSNTYYTSNVPASFDKNAYEDEITAEAIIIVISHLIDLGYEIIEDNNMISTIFQVRRNEKEFSIVIRPSNGKRYKLYQKEKETLSQKDSELWLSNGYEVNQETYISLIDRMARTRFIPLEKFEPGRLIG